MRFFLISVLFLLPLFFSFVFGAVREYRFTSAQRTCDIRDCQATVPTAQYEYTQMKAEDKLYMGAVRLINEMYPAPLIEADEGDTIKVHYTNTFVEGGTSLHWHGMFLKNRDFMDGVVGITQCVINRHETFTYEFIAEPSGSHWYHSHAGIEALNGVAGAMIIHRKHDFLYNMYGIPGAEGREGLTTDIWAPPPRAERVVAITELWNDVHLTTTGFIGEGVPLINGKVSDGSARFPYHRFAVTSDQCFRFRWMFLNAEQIGFTYLTINIEGHNQTIVQLDGIDVDHRVADSFRMTFAQRLDTIVCPRPGKANYKINFLPAEGYSFVMGTHAPFGAILAVDGATEADPLITGDALPKTINFQYDDALGHGSFTPSNFVGKIPTSLFSKIGYGNYGEWDKVNLALPAATHSVQLELGVFDAGNFIYEMYMVKDRPFKFPDTPLVFTEQCKDEDTHVTEVPLNAVVDIIVNNPKDGAHPMHLHGGAFWVLGVGHIYPIKSSIKDAKCAPNEITMHDTTLPGHWGCPYDPVKDADKLNTVNPPLRDTVLLPPHSWVYLRWKANNPGYWFFHCHIEHHMAEGMLHAFSVGPSYRTPTPKHMPQCGKCRTDIAHDCPTNKFTYPSEPAPQAVPARPVTSNPPSCPPPTNNHPKSGDGKSTVNVNFQEMLKGFQH